eukprot:4884372-Amphidinium_carterae.1
MNIHILNSHSANFGTFCHCLIWVLSSSVHLLLYLAASGRKGVFALRLLQTGDENIAKAGAKVLLSRGAKLTLRSNLIVMSGKTYTEKQWRIKASGELVQKYFQIPEDRSMLLHTTIPGSSAI